MSKISKAAKAKRQREAIERLQAARERGPESVAIEAVLGNQYSRQIVRGRLEPGVEPFVLAEAEVSMVDLLRRLLDESMHLRESVERSLRSGEETIGSLLGQRGFVREVNEMIDVSVALAHEQGRISDQELAEIKQARGVR